VVRRSHAEKLGGKPSFKAIMHSTRSVERALSGFAGI
jgi:hypothetical protein